MSAVVYPDVLSALKSLRVSLHIEETPTGFRVRIKSPLYVRKERIHPTSFSSEFSHQEMLEYIANDIAPAYGIRPVSGYAYLP